MYQLLKKKCILLFTILAISTVSVIPAAAEETQKSTETATDFHYVHDPRLNPKAMEDIVEDPTAIYGFSPNPESTRLGEYAAAYDWSDPAVVEQGRQDRIAYHEKNAGLYTMLEQLQAEGKSIEEIARTISAERNRLRLAAYEGDPEGLATVKKSNLDTYGNEEGPSADSLYEKYGSWETVLEKAFSINSGMDACLGLYDDYYDLYVASGQLVSSYTVVKGDYLMKIAERQLGSKTLWNAIYQMNTDIVKNPNLIYPGQILKMPSDPTAPGVLDVIEASQK